MVGVTSSDWRAGCGEAYLTAGHGKDLETVLFCPAHHDARAHDGNHADCLYRMRQAIQRALDRRPPSAPCVA